MMENNKWLKPIPSFMSVKLNRLSLILFYVTKYLPSPSLITSLQSGNMDQNLKISRMILRLNILHYTCNSYQFSTKSRYGKTTNESSILQAKRNNLLHMNAIYLGKIALDLLWISGVILILKNYESGLFILIWPSHLTL